MKTEYTPGPWHTFHGKGEITIQWDDRMPLSEQFPRPSAKYIARVDFARSGARRGGHVLYFSCETDEANARLIAAAPELLEACKQMAIEAGRDGSLRDVEGYGVLVRNYVLPAIAKAEGRETGD